MAKIVQQRGKFGTAPVFFTAISTILGAIMFLRFGYAVGHTGFWGTLLIIVFAHLVTIPTGLAIAEIATNQRVRGGGEYYIISRSFGINVGAAIGLALFLSQAISVAFYMIAFAEAFKPVMSWINQNYDIKITDTRVVSIPAMALLSLLLLTKGANLGMKALYVVVAILGMSLVSFFMGNPTDHFDPSLFNLSSHVAGNDDFFKVFAIVFPAFTGMTAGVGLSGDLRDPKKSIPIGTLTATISGMVIYIFIAYKLATSASPSELANADLIMSNIAIWGPIIPIGLAAATISSAIGSILVAPRTLQALASDKVLPSQSITRWLSFGKGETNEPFNATLVTSAIAFLFIAQGNVDSVARIISMFFMVTYGAICLISFLQHFAADPAYRPGFTSRWYISLIGFLLTIYLMFKMEPLFAFLSLLLMSLIYYSITTTRDDKEGLSKIFQGVIFQISRKLQIFLQKAEKDSDNWRPSFICISHDFFRRPAAFDLLAWISHRSGFGTFIHFIKGYLSKDTNRKAREELSRIIKIAGVNKSNVFIDTMISPSFTSAVAQAIQLPSVSGKEVNAMLFEFFRESQEHLDDIIDNVSLVRAIEYDLCILGSTERGFGVRSSIHIWVKPGDIANASLMILLGYIIMGHPDWSHASIKISAVFPEEEIEDYQKKLSSMIKEGRLPISLHNIELIEQKAEVGIKEIINQRSQDDDLIMIGLNYENLKQKGLEVFSDYNDIGNILFVNAARERKIEQED
jgi:solute carrier family 12 sodium/potassium/chloride transporter 2